MEARASAKRLIVIGLAVVLVVSAGVFTYRELSKTPLSTLVRKDLPMLDLIIQLRDSNNQDIESGNSRIASNDLLPAADNNCPELTGGDTSSPTVASASQQRQADCPQRAIWYVKKHPVAITLFFNDGEAFLAWWDKNPDVKALVDNRFTQGLFLGLLQSLKIKAEQLNLQGLQGEFLALVLRDAIAANAQVHYDMAHGKRGWVLSYRLGDSLFSEQALPAMAGLLASSGYRLAKLPEPILEMKIGYQQLFLTQYQNRIYLAQSLEALLNVIDSDAAVDNQATAALSLTIRGEAFIDHLLPVLTGSNNGHLQFNFALKDGELGDLSLPAGPWRQALHEQLFAGVLASIPQDAFSAVAASFLLSPTLTANDWLKFAETGPLAAANASGAGGLALVWDFDEYSPQGAIGVIVANPDQAEATPAYQQYFADAEQTSECGGGRVFLAATSPRLLTRMKEACQRQSLSPLDWQRGAQKQRLQAAQIVTFINPAAAVRELFLAGGVANAGEDQTEFSPQWKQQYQQAWAAMRRDGEQLFAKLPIFVYAGKASDSGEVSLPGQLLVQEER